MGKQAKTDSVRNDEVSDMEIVRSIVGEQKYLELVAELGGTAIYIPRVNIQKRRSRVIERYYALVSEAKTPSTKAIIKIATEEKMTTRNVYRVLAKARKEKLKSPGRKTLQELYGKPQLKQSEGM